MRMSCAVSRNSALRVPRTSSAFVTAATATAATATVAQRRACMQSPTPESRQGSCPLGIRRALRLGDPGVLIDCDDVAHTYDIFASPPESEHVDHRPGDIVAPVPAS